MLYIETPLLLRARILQMQTLKTNSELNLGRLWGCITGHNSTIDDSAITIKEFFYIVALCLLRKSYWVMVILNDEARDREGTDFQGKGDVTWC